MSKENNVKLLWDCAHALNADGHTQQLLKSYYMTKCRKLAKKSLQMPKEKFAAAKMCARCSSSWNDVDYRMALRPQQIARSTKAKKLIAKLEESRPANEKRAMLSRKQRKRAKWLRKRVLSNVEIECELCHHKTRLPLEKPQKKNQEEEEAIQEETPAPVPLKTKKKKKHKNKTAGLNIAKPAPPSTTAALKTEILPAKAEQKPAAALTTTTKQTPNSNAHAKTNTPGTPIGAKLSQSLKAKKSKKKSKMAASPIAPTVQSKTQQKNSLLQLAALLKAQTAKPSTNTAQQRLEALLK